MGSSDAGYADDAAKKPSSQLSDGMASNEAIIDIQADGKGNCKHEQASGEFEVVITREYPDDFIGMSVQFPEGTTLMVDSLKAIGLVPNWNARHNHEPDKQIKIGDVILSVSGESGNWSKMVTKMQQEDRVVLLVRRGEAREEDKELTPNRQSNCIEGVVYDGPGHQLTVMKILEVPEAEKHSGSSTTMETEAASETVDDEVVMQSPVEMGDDEDDLSSLRLKTHR
eukprot:TRINITY_DN3406_c0_g1_i1.p1 TRINITY_DN3406_c0_g1~~TRINITY_DN3406_c0_g1_i1.p1  ORF type:complete len:226 (+),score=54.92 TRINITY_DN3406_c0_g1_i1:66-743(+)